MTKACGISLLAVVALFLAVAPAAFADSTMVLTGVGSGNVLDGAYIGPYIATVGGVANTPVICDDYSDESYIPESWTAYTSGFPSLSKVDFKSGSMTQNYEEAAYLALELLAAPPNSLQAGEIQYALWGVFDSNAISDLTAYNATDGAAAAAYLTDAETHYSKLTAAQLAEFTFYTPNTNDPITCGGAACASTPPQEFIVVDAPEPGTILLLCTGLTGLFLLKRRQKLASPI
jgi:hypothetical protein